MKHLSSSVALRVRLMLALLSGLLPTRTIAAILSSLPDRSMSSSHSSDTATPPGIRRVAVPAGGPVFGPPVPGRLGEWHEQRPAAPAAGAGGWQCDPGGEPAGWAGILLVAMVSASEGWAVGVESSILHYTGVSWQSVTSPASGNLNSVAMISANAGWAVGLSGSLLHHSGGAPLRREVLLPLLKR